MQNNMLLEALKPFMDEALSRNFPHAAQFKKIDDSICDLAEARRSLPHGLEEEAFYYALSVLYMWLQIKQKKI